LAKTNLDVGTGSLRGHKPMLQEGILRMDIQKTEFNLKILDVVGDVEHLPFKNGSFSNVYARHVLEHTNNPYRAFDELLRVASKFLVVSVPHILSKVARQDSKLPHDEHKHIFRKKWFQQALGHHGFSSIVNRESWFMFLNRPYEIEVTIWK